MEGGFPSEGWQALSNISSFMHYSDKRKQLKIFGQLDARLDYCEFLIRKQSNKNDYQRFKSKKRKKELNEDLVNALKSLVIDELILYYNTLVEQLVNLTLNVCTPPVIENKSFIICEAYSRTYSLKMWKRKKLRFDRENHIIYAEKDKKIKIYDLSNYLIRKSEKGDYFSLALEAHNNVPLEKSRTAHFGFQYKNTYILWFSSIQKSIEYKQWESLVVSLNKEQLIAKNRDERKEKEWDRLNKTQGNHDVHSDQTGQLVQSAIYIPLSSPQSEEGSLTLQTASQKEESQNHECILTNPFKVEQEVDLQAIVKESFTYKLAHCANAFPNIQDLQFQLQVEDGVIKKIKQQISFATALLDDVDINTHFMEDVTHFNQIEFTDAPKNATIYQNITHSNQFKLIYLLPNHRNLQVKAVLQHFLDVSTYKTINKTISTCLIKAVIYSQSSTINYQQHHSYNRLYRPRQFYYIRHVTRNLRNQYFIIDRSISNSLPLIADSFYARGQMQTIYKFYSDKDGIRLAANIRINNGGSLADNQNVSLCKKQVLDLSLGLWEFYSKDSISSARVRYYNIQSHSKHHPAPQKHTSAQNQMVLSIELDHPVQVKQPVIKPQQQKKKHKQSFYRIPRHQIIKDSSLSEYIGEQPEEQDIFQMRKSYSPQRKTYIESRQSKLSPDRTKAEEQEWQMQVEPQWKDEWMVDEQNGGFIMKKNPTMKEKEVLKKIIETVAKKSLLGKNIENMSFPVDILVPESRLERLLNNLSSAPFVFGGISDLPILQRFMKTVVFSLQVSLLSLHNGKPFDALLGETYQCRFGNQYEGYAEQISVLPSITAIYLLGSDFTVSAALKQKFKVTMNSASFQNEGVYRVNIGNKKGNKDEICFTTPPMILNGMTFSRRQFLLEGRSFHWIQSLNIVLVLHFEPKNTFSRSQDAKKDYFEGTIYEVSPQFMGEFALNKQSPSQVHIVKIVGKIMGRWTKYITFNNATIQFSEVLLSQMYSNSSPLPSDSSFRQDIQKLRECSFEQAQVVKDCLQQAQRKDKVLREESLQL